MANCADYPTRLSAAQPIYGTSRWKRVRLHHLRKEPLCRACLVAGRTTPANTVDHIIPHDGDESLAWDENNLQSLCPTCHSGDKKRAELSGLRAYRGCTADGAPLDPEHHWNAT